MPQSGQAAVAECGWVTMVTRSGVGRTCTTDKPGGIRGKGRLDKGDFRGELRPPHVLTPNRDRHPGSMGQTDLATAAREVRVNQSPVGVDTDRGRRRRSPPRATREDLRALRDERGHRGHRVAHARANARRLGGALGFVARRRFRNGQSGARACRRRGHGH